MATWQEQKMNGKKRVGKQRNRYQKNAQKCYISHPCSEDPNDTIFTTFGRVVDPTYIMTCANFVCYQLKSGHFTAVKNLPFSHDLNGWLYNRQALTCCRDIKNFKSKASTDAYKTAKIFLTVNNSR